MNDRTAPGRARLIPRRAGHLFWGTLHEVGLTTRLFEPREFRDLLALGIGLTDMSKLGAGMDHQIAKHKFDPDLFADNVRRYRPSAIAFTSKKAASIWLRVSSTRGIALGRQDKCDAGFPEIFVLPSPSGAARSYWSIADAHACFCATIKAGNTAAVFESEPSASGSHRNTP